jgi:putative isomerase
MPLFLHIASAKRAARMARIAADPQKFYPGIPTAAYDTPGYLSHGYWRGPAWLNTSFFALKGLHDYGFTDLATTMRCTLLGWVARDPSTIWEYYDSRNGNGGGARGFGWSSAFTIAFILDWDNDHLTWFLRPPPARTQR